MYQTLGWANDLTMSVVFPNIHLNFCRWWHDTVLFFFSAQDPMHNSENQEATASYRNVLSPHSFLPIFRTTMMMVFFNCVNQGLYWFKTQINMKCIWFQHYWKPGWAETAEGKWKSIFCLAFLTLHGLCQRRGADFLKIGLQSDFRHFKQWLRRDLILKM